MELDDLKNKLKDKLAASCERKEDLLAIIHGRSGQTIGRLKRSLAFEISISILFAILTLLLMVTTDNPNVRELSGFLFIYCLGFVVYMWRVWVQVRRSGSIYSSSMLDATRKIHDTLSQYVKVCFLFSMLAVPVVWVIMIRFGMKEAKVEKGDPFIFFRQVKFQILLAWLIVWSLFVYFLSRWYLRKLYGNHLDDLRDQIRELENG
ncbi:hypothetical protein KJS94_04855 [Flavihumibacter rivuli]|uniref:hypothetical protein n=1 Tax=Flavihumibacter rivuli TaxID=2838156 RepID=UPI001BDF4FDB|nr:hypothetical protein [Flavihumibacter rivuli]ULQ57528.1 hypothetical protein KJS94_04855 [Flavihumibacter rivuli]